MCTTHAACCSNLQGWITPKEALANKTQKPPYGIDFYLPKKRLFVCTKGKILLWLVKPYNAKKECICKGQVSDECELLLPSTKIGVIFGYVVS